MILPYVDSEISQLKSVILHRPDEALQHLTYENCKYYLFDDVLWLSKAQAEHDKFAQILSDRGINVYYFSQLLTEILKINQARIWILDKIITKEKFGIENVEAIKENLLKKEEGNLAKLFTTGLTVNDLGFQLKGFIGQYLKSSDFVLFPLPNLIFMRDSSSCLLHNVSINSFNSSVRKYESIYMAAIYLFHPQFDKGNLFVVYKGYRNCMPPLEGGDIIILNPNHIIIGLGQRSCAAAVEVIAKNLFLRNPQCLITVVELPRSRSTMHLDTVFSMVDHNILCYFAQAITSSQAWNITALSEDGTLSVKRIKNFINFIADKYGLKTTNFIKIDNHLANEQWSDGSNLLTISPGTVVSYDRNVITNQQLTKAGIEVLTMPSSELCRGRGGPHCMSSPIERSPLKV